MDLRGLRFGSWVATGLEPIFFHSPVQGATAQAESFCRLAHVTLKALQRFANKNTFYRLQTQFLEVLCLRALNSKAKISRMNLAGASHEDSPLQRVLQLAYIARPGILDQSLQGGRIKAFNFR